VLKSPPLSGRGQRIDQETIFGFEVAALSISELSLVFPLRWLSALGRADIGRVCCFCRRAFSILFV